ncbi:MAG: hypothetical protein Q4C60_01360 [Eubacteriales bacterium]|nr:hypothetical protein [Eubacteriales bacterium]
MSHSNTNAFYPVAVNRKHKDKLFCKLFSEKKNALSLFNALQGMEYREEDELEIVTLEDSVKEAVQICMENGILMPYLAKHRGEVMEMVLTEFDREGYETVLREEGREEGGVLMRTLFARLLQDHREQDMLRAVEDQEYCDRLLEEYRL